MHSSSCRLVLASCALVLLGFAQSDAALVTSLAEIPSTSATIDFSQFFAAGRTHLSVDSPPIEIDELAGETVLLRSTLGSPPGLLLGAEILGEPSNWYMLGVNGQWTPEREGFLGVGGGGGSRSVLRIEFASGPASSVGGLFNYSPDSRWSPVFVSALGADLSVLEQYALELDAPISTPDIQNVGEFRGISRMQNDIFALEISASFAVVDDVRFSRIPEPSTLGLANLLFAALLMGRKSRPGAVGGPTNRWADV